MFDKIKDKSLARRVKEHVIGKEHIFFAVVQPGFEDTAAREFLSMGFKVSPDFIEGGIEFSGRIDDCFRACIMARTSSRIVMRLGRLRAHKFDLLEKDISAFPWELYLRAGGEIKFRSSARKSMIYHTGKLEEIFARGIEERLKSHKADIILSGEERPAHSSVFTLILRNDNDLCYVSLDASGEFLYKRGHREFSAKAPLRESSAALILMEGGIGNYDRIIDPMCGSGTFSIEAAGILTRTPAAAEKDFAFMGWPCFKENNFLHIKKECLEKTVSPEKVEVEIITSDIDERAVAAAKMNCHASFPGILNPEVRDFFDIKFSDNKGVKTLLVINPPYGKRLSERDILDFYRRMGDKIKSDFKDCGAAVIVPGEAAERALGIQYNRKILFMNGGIRSAVIFKDN